MYDYPAETYDEPEREEHVGSLYENMMDDIEEKADGDEFESCVPDKEEVLEEIGKMPESRRPLSGFLEPDFEEAVCSVHHENTLVLKNYTTGKKTLTRTRSAVLRLNGTTVNLFYPSNITRILHENGVCDENGAPMPDLPPDLKIVYEQLLVAIRRGMFETDGVTEVHYDKRIINTIVIYMILRLLRVNKVFIVDFSCNASGPTSTWSRRRLPPGIGYGKKSKKSKRSKRSKKSRRRRK